MASDVQTTSDENGRAGRMATTTRLLVIEPQGLVREALVALLSTALAPAWRVEGQAAASLHDAWSALSATPDCLLLLNEALAGLPGSGGPMRALRERYPDVRTIVLAPVETRDGILQCLAAGAHGYIAQSASASELIDAVRAVGAGSVHVPAALVGPGARAEPVVPARGSGPMRVDNLTGRQRDVLLLVAEGRSTKDIARTLDLAVSTIKVHLAAVYRAVGARNRVEALCRAGLLLPSQRLPT